MSSADCEAFAENGREYYLVRQHLDGDDITSKIIAKRGYIEAGKYIFEVSLSYKKNGSKEITDADSEVLSEVLSTYTINDAVNKDGDFLIKH